MKNIQREITPISDEDLFIVLNHPSAKFDYPLHCHSDYEINLVLKTNGKRIVGDSIENFVKADLVMLGPNLPHAWKGDTVLDNHVVTIQFSEKLLSFPILEKRLFNQIKQLLLDSNRGLVFSETTILMVQEKILELTKKQGFQTVLDFFSILYTLSISDRKILVSNKYDSEDTVRVTKSRRIAKVCEYVETHFAESIRLSDVADVVNMSESAFSHFFKKQTNITFIDYLNNRRIGSACQLLLETKLTVAEVCYDSGFNNLSNFIRIFKKKKGSTPMEYRTFMQQMLIKY